MSANIAKFRATDKQPMTMQQFLDSLPLIESTMNWLLAKRIAVIGFGCTRKGAVITVAAHPAVYVAAKGSAERRQYSQSGVLRHELWSFAARGGVEICWEEVVCAN